jgi:hypothetical protein
MESIARFQEAARLGLAAKDEVFARFMVGERYAVLLDDLPKDHRLVSREFNIALTEIERALTLDRDNSIGYFAEPLNAHGLIVLDKMYRLAAAQILTERGADAAIAYLEDKLRGVKYLSRPPLLWSLLQLAISYWDGKALDEARNCLSIVLGTQPLYSADDEQNREIHDFANQILTALNSPRDR